MRRTRSVVQAILIVLMVMGLSFSAHADDAPVHTFAGGLGMPYGGFGFNYEYALNDVFAPTVGLGYLPENFGWSLGVRLYFPERASAVRGRLSALYGVTTVLEKETVSGTDYKTDNGFSMGVGVDWHFGQFWGLAADIFFAETDTPTGYKEESDDIFLALGVNYRF